MAEQTVVAMSFYEIISTGVSFLALVIAVLSWLKSNKLAKLQIQEIEERNKLKNKPSLNIAISPCHRSNHFVIANRGEGSAFNVNLELIDCEDSPFASDFYEIMPHPELKPAQAVKLLAIIHANSPLKYQVKLTWNENSSNQIFEEIFWVSR